MTVVCSTLLGLLMEFDAVLSIICGYESSFLNAVGGAAGGDSSVSLSCGLFFFFFDETTANFISQREEVLFIIMC